MAIKGVPAVEVLVALREQKEDNSIQCKLIENLIRSKVGVVCFFRHSRDAAISTGSDANDCASRWGED